MLLVPFLTTRLAKQKSLCGGKMISLLLAQQKLSEKLCTGLVTSLLLPSDPCCCILHSTRGKNQISLFPKVSRGWICPPPQGEYKLRHSPGVDQHLSVTDLHSELDLYAHSPDLLGWRGSLQHSFYLNTSSQVAFCSLDGFDNFP